MCARVCACVRACARVCARVRTCVPVCLCAGVPVCRCAGMPVCRCAGSPVRRCASVSACRRAAVRVCAGVCGCVRACAGVCGYAGVLVYVYVTYVPIYRARRVCSFARVYASVRVAEYYAINARMLGHLSMFSRRCERLRVC